MEFIVGGLAGAGATIFTNPIDVIKTRMQLQGELKASTGPPRYKGLLHAVYVIGKADGPLALQSGLSAAMLLGFTMNSVRLGLYHIGDLKGWTKSSNGEVAVHKALVWSCACGAVSGFVANPMFVVKTRLQSGSKTNRFQYKGTLDAFTKIYQRSGIRGLYAGLDANCARIAVGTAAQLTSYAAAKDWLRRRGYFMESPITQSFLASIVSSILVVAIETPLDVVSTRLFNQGNKRLYRSVLDCFQKTYATEGIRGLYKGAGPLYLRIAPHTTLSLVIWDMLNTVLDAHKVS